ncbi:hydrogen peroxide-inducible genes activator [Agrobacterium larrymoorei]|uniref:HTH-type transcriptional regulator TtuA n=2 Tax=Agrobacterium larrymoorei TaxID=160699 RepID=A0A4D7DPX5_9HYPH|nr:hydrogen peroxide-inducible genes activator [Agrobacterium larrymoorei]QCI98651.1 hydrogen peroxide-inducible genes activator [Agrobacterium larrymoorei]QYA05884.1 hydrogen peroxide-inducible genes activator [Agrobacterium larrymoorei]
MMTLRQMRYFDALARTQHFGKAAAEAHISQPALSVQIMEMEEHLGVKLVERGRGGITITPKGEDVLRHVRAILLEVERLEETARKTTGALEGLVRIGIIPTIAPYLVPRLVPHLRARHALIEIELKEAVTDRLLSDLAARKLDAVIAAVPVDGDGLETCHLFTDRFFMAIAKNDDNILMSPVDEGKVDLDRLLLLEEGHCLRDQALAVCGTAGKRSLVNYGATSMATLLQMVSHDMGMTLIPEIAISTETTRNNLRIVPFAEPAPAREIGLVWRKSSARKADIEALAQAVRDCASPSS